MKVMEIALPKKFPCHFEAWWKFDTLFMQGVGALTSPIKCKEPAPQSTPNMWMK